VVIITEDLSPVLKHILEPNIIMVLLRCGLVQTQSNLPTKVDIYRVAFSLTQTLAACGGSEAEEFGALARGSWGVMAANCGA
jgi:hypothetical protein